MPAHVLYYVPYLAWGGSERNLVDLASRLDRGRFLASVWCSALGPAAAELQQAGINVYLAPVSENEAEIESALAPWLKSLRADILHSYNYHRHCREVIAAKFAGIPIVVLARGNMRHWDLTGRMCDWEIRRNKFVDVVVANCQAVASVCESVEQIEWARIRVIHNGVGFYQPPAQSAQLRTLLGWSEQHLMIGSVGNFRKVKGHDILLHAFRIVADAAPGARLAICGSDQGELASLMALRKQLGLTARVAFLSGLPAARLFYRECDVYVHTSFSEGLSNAIMEAMAAGAPVVATAVGGTSEMIRTGETGMLTAPGDVEEIAAAILELSRDQHLRRRLGTAGQADIARRFSLTETVRSHEGLYEELLGP